MKAWWVLCLVPTVYACGANVDLGGSSDSGTSGDATLEPDASISDAEAFAEVDAPVELSANCEPCSGAQDCLPTSACVRLANNLYCASTCTNGGAACASGEVCQTLVTAADASASACAPASGRCDVVAPPPAPAPDGAPLDQCGDLVGPNVSADCRGCQYDCQRNGCYGGWWCDRDSRRCQRPPRTCP